MALMKKLNVYGKSFFEKAHKGAYDSAVEIVPILIELLNPKSVIDIGCGSGEFLKVFLEKKKEKIKIFGIDGEYVLPHLLIPKKYFKPIDLSKKFKITNKGFDLAICLEVAEHLPNDSGEYLIKTLTDLSPIVLFSAAIPGQGGTDHLNEQWQEYWARIFKKYGFSASDIIRERIWKNKNVKVWYRQNSILYCSNDALKNNELLLEGARRSSVLDIVHPDLFLSTFKSPFEIVRDGIIYRINNLLSPIRRLIFGGS